MDYDTITNAISSALKELAEKSIKGKESTPFLLSKVKEVTGGKSLDANIQLVYNNAAVGADIANELCRL